MKVPKRLTEDLIAVAKDPCTKQEALNLFKKNKIILTIKKIMKDISLVRKEGDEIKTLLHKNREQELKMEAKLEETKQKLTYLAKYRLGDTVFIKNKYGWGGGYLKGKVSKVCATVPLDKLTFMYKVNKVLKNGGMGKYAIEHSYKNYKEEELYPTDPQNK